MADRSSIGLDHASLETLLAGTPVEFPPSPDLVRPVLHRLRTPTSRRPRGSIRPALVLAAVLALLLAAGTVAAGAFGIGPLRILFSEEPLPSVNVPDTPLGTRLALGRRVTAAEAASVADVPLQVPSALGSPDETYVSELGIVTLLWASDADLPALGGTDIGLLLMVIPGDLDPDLVTKVVVESRATLEPTMVDGGDAFWISGAPHVLRYFQPDGSDGAVTSRLVGDALVWERPGAVLRIESALGRDATLMLAESMRAWP